MSESELYNITIQATPGTWEVSVLGNPKVYVFVKLTDTMRFVRKRLEIPGPMEPNPGKFSLKRKTGSSKTRSK